MQFVIDFPILLSRFMNLILNLEEQQKFTQNLKKNYRWCNFINW